LGDDLSNVSPGKAEMIRILLHFKAKTKMKEMQWDFATILTGSNILAYYIFLRLGLGAEDSFKWGWREVFSDENASNIESSKIPIQTQVLYSFFLCVFSESSRMPPDGQHVNSLASGTSTAHMKQSYSSSMITPWPGRSGLRLNCFKGSHQVDLDGIDHVENTGEGYLRTQHLNKVKGLY